MTSADGGVNPRPGPSPTIPVGAVPVVGRLEEIATRPPADQVTAFEELHRDLEQRLRQSET